jgi:hypothetical protein
MSAWEDMKAAGKMVADLEFELAEARAEIAEQGFIIQQTQIDRDTWRSNYHGAEEKLTALAARHEKALIEGAARLAELAEARAQIAAKDAALRPLAALQIPAKPQGNAGAYSIFHKDIEAARAALAKPAQETK